MKHTSKCPECNGRGEDMIGVMPRPNMSSYSDYDEVWAECDFCGGTGNVTDEQRRQWWLDTYGLIEPPSPLAEVDEGEIPF